MWRRIEFVAGDIGVGGGSVVCSEKGSLLLSFVTSSVPHLLSDFNRFLRRFSQLLSGGLSERQPDSRSESHIHSGHKAFQVVFPAIPPVDIRAVEQAPGGAAELVAIGNGYWRHIRVGAERYTPILSGAQQDCFVQFRLLPTLPANRRPVYPGPPALHPPNRPRPGRHQ